MVPLFVFLKILYCPFVFATGLTCKESKGAQTTQEITIMYKLKQYSEAALRHRKGKRSCYAVMSVLLHFELGFAQIESGKCLRFLFPNTQAHLHTVRTCAQSLQCSLVSFWVSITCQSALISLDSSDQKMSSDLLDWARRGS